MTPAAPHPWLPLLQRLAEAPAAGDTNHLLAHFDEHVADLSEGDHFAVHLLAEGRARPPEAHARRLLARFGPRVDHEALVAACLAREHPGLSAPGATVLAPLYTGARILGVLVADRRDAGGVIGARDLPLLAALAGLLAHALAGAVAPDARAGATAPRPPDPRLAVIGQAPGLRSALATLDAASLAGSPLLISGPPGVGKTLFARLAHQRGGRAAMPCQVLACAGLEEEPLLARLLGRADPGGRFQPGFLELAHGGTLVLDDVGMLPASAQHALLALLDRQELVRPGSHQAIALDVRLVVTSDEGLEARLQPRLWSRLAAAHARLPGLIERSDDLDRLADHFLADWSLRLGTTRRVLSARARLALHARAWPGHVRELRATLELAGARAAGAVVTELDLAPVAAARSEQAPLRLGSLEDVEARHLQVVLAHVQGNKSQAAEILGIGRNTLYAKLKEYGIGD